MDIPQNEHYFENYLLNTHFVFLKKAIHTRNPSEIRFLKYLFYKKLNLNRVQFIQNYSNALSSKWPISAQFTIIDARPREVSDTHYYLTTNVYMCLEGKEGFLEHVREYKGVLIVCQIVCHLIKDFQ